MKKNKMMRIASILLVATLITVCAISGTFAKYVSGGSAADTARVAKWGVKVEASGNLFAKNYLLGTDAANRNKPTASTDDTKISVESSNTDLLVAPGTQSADGMVLSLTGTPEVDARIKLTIKAKDVSLAKGYYGVMEQVAVNEVNFDSLKAGLYTKSTDTYTKLASTATFDATATYYRILNGTQAVVADGGYKPVKYAYGSQTDKTANEIAAAIADGAKGTTTVTVTTDDAKQETTYAVERFVDSNTDLSTLGIQSANKLTWAWAYNNTIDSDWDNVDYEDTVLGDLAAGLEVVYGAANADALTVLTLDAANFTAKSGSTVVAVYATTFDFALTAVQVD